MVPKNLLAAEVDIRKSAKGHCTSANTPRNAVAQMTVWSQTFQVPIFLRTRSSTMAGTIRSSGKLGGTNWVTGLNTGPSFGSAGNSGSTQTSDARNTVYMPVTMVADQGWSLAKDTPIRAAGTANDIAI